MGIHIPKYYVLCDRCGSVIDSVPTRQEADEIVSGRDSFAVNGRVYCCDSCGDEGEAAR